MQVVKQQTTSRNVIVCGDAYELLVATESESVDLIELSPPYFNVRDYGVTGQIGLEATVDEYIDSLARIFAEAKRVLKPTGALFIVIDDTYNGTKKGNTDRKNTKANNDGTFVKKITKRIADRSLLNIPSRLAQKLTDEQGWIQRNDIIWFAENKMPENVNDRWSVDYEHVLFFTKNNKTLFWVNKKTGLNVNVKPPGLKGVEGVDWDWEQVEPERNGKKIPKTWVQRPDGNWWRKKSHWQGFAYYFAMQYEPYSEATLKEVGQKYNGKNTKDYESAKAQPASDAKRRMIRSLDPSRGRIQRCVWRINVKPLKEKHFAAYPKELAAVPIAACCPKAICTKCGLPRVPLYTEERVNTRPGLNTGNAKSGGEDDPNQKLHKSKLSRFRQQIIRRPSKLSACSCGAPFEKGLVLDFFFGAGTTALAAVDADVDWLGYEIKKEYCEVAQRRIDEYRNGKR